MTKPHDARTAVYHELMWPQWNPRSEAYGTSQERAKELLDAHRAAALREAADLIDAEQDQLDAEIRGEYGELDRDTEVEGAATRRMAEMLRRRAAGEAR
ncbi:hypothetical protein ACFQ67_00245 [Streptomyces sp. NPDC056488]|uniref:hypothetical protein n=1 Tax=Streptomyces sp. NPDC056488 TaxID=3345836 RepID=UPI0036AF3D32